MTSVMTRRNAVRPVTVFVCGEPQRGDDAAAFHAVAGLPAAILGRAAVVRAGQLDVQHLLDLPEDSACIVVDAVAGIAPGLVWRATLDDIAARAAATDRAARPKARSTHQVPLELTLALAVLLRGAPLRGSFVGVGGAAYAVGRNLSPAVAAAIPDFAAAIAAEVDRLAADEFAEQAA